MVVEEDLLAYRLPGEVFQALLADARFARNFTIGLGERLRQSLETRPRRRSQPDLTPEVGALVHGAAVWVEPGTTVREAARVMRERSGSPPSSSAARRPAS